MTFFTSDTHFGHRRIIEYCARPFADVAEMESELVRRWNERVGPGDTVYHLGDVYFGKVAGLPPLLARLNGGKILIRGNHDTWTRTFYRKAGFAECWDRLGLVQPEAVVHLEHRPIERIQWTGDLQLCGHVHEAWKRKGDAFNVGVDVWDFYPRTLAEILATPEDK